MKVKTLEIAIKFFWNRQEDGRKRTKTKEISHQPNGMCYRGIFLSEINQRRWWDAISELVFIVSRAIKLFSSCFLSFRMFPRQQEIREFHQEVNEIKPLTLFLSLFCLPTPHKNQISFKDCNGFYGSISAIASFDLVRMETYFEGMALTSCWNVFKGQLRRFVW